MTLRLVCITDLNIFFLVMGLICFVDEIQFMLISSYFCIRSVAKSLTVVRISIAIQFTTMNIRRKLL